MTTIFLFLFHLFLFSQQYFHYIFVAVNIFGSHAIPRNPNDSDFPTSRERKRLNSFFCDFQKILFLYLSISWYHFVYITNKHEFATKKTLVNTSQVNIVKKIILSLTFSLFFPIEPVRTMILIKLFSPNQSQICTTSHTTHTKAKP